ncbi:hypothetical protein MRB53_026051 [Persea americana]|uniref:Uncharacterized protein n=1 Tax=Persea americana TaxID=3435 RepID=A0ACC2LGX1_PERAE|nr:hypothetical protein MRB53_026051 [Persea americana]
MKVLQWWTYSITSRDEVIIRLEAIGKEKERIPGVPKIQCNYNPAAWVLEVSSMSVEKQLGIDFSQVYRASSLYRKFGGGGYCVIEFAQLPGLYMRCLQIHMGVFLKDYFSFQHGELLLVAAILVALPLLFASLSVISTTKVNLQKR